MEQLLGRLAGSGYELHALSNYPSWWQIIEGKLQLSRHLRWTYLSCTGPMEVRHAHGRVRSHGAARRGPLQRPWADGPLVSGAALRPKASHACVQWPPRHVPPAPCAPPHEANAPATAPLRAQGYRKPDAEAYARVLAHLGVPAGQVLFVDDRQVNVAVGGRAGGRAGGVLAARGSEQGGAQGSSTCPTLTLRGGAR